MNNYRFLEMRVDNLGRKKMTQDELSNIIHIDRNRIQQLETSPKVIPKEEELRAYCNYFNTTSDYLLGIRNTKPVDENIAMIAKVTGLSNDAIEMIKILSNYRKEYNSFLPGLGAYIDAINAILEFQYKETKKTEKQDNIPAWSVLHYIKQYLSSGIYEREQQDRLRICDGNVWVDIDNGDILIKNNEQYTIQNKSAINSSSGSGENSKTVHIVNIRNKKERYVVEINKMFESYSKDNIFRELDKIKDYIEKKRK